MKKYIYALLPAVLLATGSLKAQEQPLRWELNLGMVNPFNSADELAVGKGEEREVLLPTDQSMGMGIKYAFGSYAWRFSLAGRSAYYSNGNPNLGLYRSYNEEVEEGSVEFRMGIEKRKIYNKAQFYFGADLVMGRVRKHSEQSFLTTDSNEEHETFSTKRTDISGLSLMLGMKYFFHQHFSILLESRADALAYELHNNQANSKGISDTGAQFILRPLGMISINYHF